MSNIIMRIMMGIMLLSAGSFVKTVVLSIISGGSKTPSSEAQFDSIVKILDFASPVFYIMGAISIFLAFSELLLEASPSNAYRSPVVKKEKYQFELKDEYEPKDYVAPVISSITDFNDEKLNSLFNEIQNKLSLLKDNDLVMKDIESARMLEQTAKVYLPKIYSDYSSIPIEKRKESLVKGNPYELAVEQLVTILKGLEEIENKMISTVVDSQKINNIFLKEKVASL